MADQWILIDAETKALVDETVYDEEPTPAEGQEVRLVMPGYPADWYWSSSLDGFVRKDETAALITVGHFLLTYLTFAEQVAIHTAAQTDMEVQTMLFMLQGFTDGIRLSDPSLGAFLQKMEAKNLLTADRVTAILAGQTP
jgi:hypothetical protein